MPVLLILICLILSSIAVKADPAEQFLNLLNSVTALKSGEHLSPSPPRSLARVCSLPSGGAEGYGLGTGSSSPMLGEWV